MDKSQNAPQRLDSLPEGVKGLKNELRTVRTDPAGLPYSVIERINQ